MDRVGRSGVVAAIVAAAVALAACAGAGTPGEAGAVTGEAAPPTAGPQGSESGQAEQEDRADPAHGSIGAEHLRQLGVNELGVIPILMFHRVTDEPGPYDLTPEQFREELVAWKDAGFIPVRMADVVEARIDVPRGYSPMVITFDDSSPSQFRLLENGEVDPDSAVGILVELAARDPSFKAVATFYINEHPFGVTGQAAQRRLAELYAMGFELGNHTLTHANLRELSETGVQRELALGAQLIWDAVPDAQVTSVALPFGLSPDNMHIVREGTYGDITYRHDAVLLAGAGPAASPFSTALDWNAVPRIRPEAWFDPERPNHGSGYWRWHLTENFGVRYVSDGDPSTVTFPAELQDRLDPRFADRANPYERLR